ncbi:hypothetical protein ABFT80_00975 [Mesorhizobium sp. SB112]|uniref:hypothetical protein n=1 Tax=Mesorhizobium sp. SB112 TaxID=3151853 RepID=UPI00326666C2
MAKAKPATMDKDFKFIESPHNAEIRNTGPNRAVFSPLLLIALRRHAKPYRNAYAPETHVKLVLLYLSNEDGGQLP